MIELIFVIVVLGILAAVAVPKFAATRVDAQISKGAADVASIRSGIVSERQTRLIKGDSDFIKNGTDAGELDYGGLFGGILMYPLTDGEGKDGSWSGGEGTYTFTAGGVDTEFEYTPADGKFDCEVEIGNYCKELANK